MTDPAEQERIAQTLASIEARLAELERHVEHLAPRAQTPAPAVRVVTPSSPAFTHATPPPIPAGAPVDTVPVAARAAAVRMFQRSVVHTEARENTFESTIGLKWASWGGGAALLLGVAFFLRYAWDRGWLRPPPEVRVLLAVLFGAALCGAGEWLYRKRMRPLAAALYGTGTAVLFISFFGAHAYFDPPVMGLTSAYVGVILTAALGVFLALRIGLLSQAILSLAGAYLAPVILSARVDKSLELLTYLGCVSAAGLIVSYFRGDHLRRRLSTSLPDGHRIGLAAFWPGLRWFVLAVTYFWFLVWWFDTGRKHDHDTLGQVWMATMFAAMLIEAFVSAERAIKLRDVSLGNAAEPAPLDRILEAKHIGPSLANILAALMLVNTGFTFGAFYFLLQRGSDSQLGAVALLLAAVQAIVAIATRLRQVMWSALIQVAALVTLATPLLLDEFHITMAWLTLATAIALLAWQLNLPRARAWVVVLLALTVLRLVTFDLHDPGLRSLLVEFNGQQITRWLLMIWCTGMLLHAAGWMRPRVTRWVGAQHLIERFEARKVSLEPAGPNRPHATPQYATPNSDWRLPVHDPLGALLAAAGSVLAIGATEMMWSGASMTFFVMLWLTPMIVFAPFGRELGYGWHALWIARLASLRWLVVDNLLPLLESWELPRLDTTTPLLNLTALNGVLLCAALILFGTNARLVASIRWNRGPLRAMSSGRWLIDATAGWVGVLVFAWLNFEMLRFIDLLANQGRLRDPVMVKQMALSVLWATVGLTSIIVGFQRKIRPLRYVALALLGITLAKVLLVDMANVQAVWRVLSFMAVGALLICVSYVYHRQSETRPVEDR